MTVSTGESQNQSVNLTISPVGWLILLLLLYYWAQSRTGYRLIYYALVLILVFLLVQNGDTIQRVMIKGEVQAS
ncbi:hypothetical protein [Alicyclobacillus shizuokensis]|uniref:hypothetical protein n=1 Tax=Alicyclobacillus shizuokensis TaxID=392014 RepID=UPI000832F80D|nr:hypothetical protein [Alicyclobacillus shizuokensis]